jgi:uncharacterized protein YbcI
VSIEQTYLKGGELNAALTSAVVGIYRTHLGRGPSSASSHHEHDVVTVVMRDVLTNVEKTLAHGLDGPAVADMRRLFQDTMEEDFTAAVERLTGHKVLAFMGCNHVDPDIAVELFFLDRSL